MSNFKKTCTSIGLVLVLLTLYSCTNNNETNNSNKNLHNFTQNIDVTKKVFACSADTSGKGINPFTQENNISENNLFAKNSKEITGPSHAKLSNESVLAITENPTPSLPVLVESCDGVETVVTDVSRIVVADLHGTLTETVFALGLGNNVVGKDRSANFPESKNVTTVTNSGHDLNAEAILTLNPTVILTDKTIGPLSAQQQLRDTGIPVVFFDQKRSMAGIPAQVEAVSQALGIPDVGKQLSQNIINEVAANYVATEESQQPVRIAFLYLRGNAGIYLMGGPGSGADSLIAAIGAKDVGTDIGLTQPFTTLTSEALVQANPDVILVMSTGLESVGGVENLTKIAGISETNAGMNQRVVDMEDTVLLSFGSRTPQIIEALKYAVYRE